MNYAEFTVVVIRPGEMLAGETIGANRSASSEYNHDLGASQSALRTVFRNSPKW